MDKVYENQHGVKFKLVERYLVRRITEDGLVKCFESSWGSIVGRYSSQTKEEAIELTLHHGLSDAVILTVIEKDYNYE